MSESRFHNFEDPLVSFNELVRFGKVLRIGPYAGYDNAAYAGNNVTISHGASALTYILADGTGNSPPIGVIITPQMTTIHEDDDIVVPVDYNPGNANDRIDLLVYEHSYLDSAPGAAGVYSIIKGSLSATTAPSISNPLTQVIVGRFLIKGNAPDHSETVFERAHLNHSTNITLTASKTEIHLSPLYHGEHIFLSGDFTIGVAGVAVIFDFADIEVGVPVFVHFDTDITDYSGPGGLLIVRDNVPNIIYALTSDDLRRTRIGNLTLSIIWDGSSYSTKALVGFFPGLLQDEFDAKLNKTPTDWIDISSSLNNGWESWVSSVVKYRITDDGYVEFRGDLTPENSDNPSFFTLPVEARPNENQNAPIVNPRFSGTDPDKLARLLVRSDGNCQVDPYSVDNRYSLDGVKLSLT